MTAPKKRVQTAALLFHPMWGNLAPYFKIEVCAGDGHKRPRFRIEVVAMPEGLVPRALELEVPCCECGRTISPIRYRRSPGNKRDSNVGHHLYYACACPLSVSMGCSRGASARDNYQAVKHAVEASRLPVVGQGELFVAVAP